MPFLNGKKTWFGLAVFFTVSIWTWLIIRWMYINYFFTDPYNPTLIINYGHNGADAFQTFGVITLIGCFVLLATLVPYFFSRHYWIRPLVLQCVFDFWLVMMTMGAMHSGGVQSLHLLWTFGVNVIIFALLAASVISEIVVSAKRKSQKLQ